MILFSRLLMLVLIVVALVFCMSNLDAVTVKLLAWESPEMPLFLVLLFVFFFGFFLALFWQALRSVTTRRAPHPSPVQPVTPELNKEKEKRTWGRRKDRAKKEGDKDKEQKPVAESSQEETATVEEEPTVAGQVEGTSPEKVEPAG